MVLLFVGLSSCNSTDKQQNNEAVEQTDSSAVKAGEAVAVYQCPMKCEGDKTYSEPGKCPECGMDLEKLE